MTTREICVIIHTNKGNISLGQKLLKGDTNNGYQGSCLQPSLQDLQDDLGHDRKYGSQCIIETFNYYLLFNFWKEKVTMDMNAILAAVKDLLRAVWAYIQEALLG